jgi:fibrillarin-like pre-rRNA processing protein
MKITDFNLPNVHFLDIPTESRHWLATVNLNKGMTVYNERLFTQSGVEYRLWDAYKSKLAACIQSGMKIPNFQNSRILYLGAATGSTCSHVSDIIGTGPGKLLALEFSAKAARRLIQLAKTRSNIIPVVADARNPADYATTVRSVDFIFQDISQVNQAQIFIDNAKAFLKPNGKAIFIIKAASIDTTKTVEVITADTIEKVTKAGFTVLETCDISKFEKEHRALLISN